DDHDENHHETYILYFRPTQNAPPGASGKMKISVDASRGDTRVKFSVRHAYPNTLYTIWTVFNELRWPLPKKGVDVPASSAAKRPGFPQAGNGVSPLPRLPSGPAAVRTTTRTRIRTSCPTRRSVAARTRDSGSAWTPRP